MQLQRFQIGNMDCAGCAREVESAVQKLDGVHFAEVEFLSCELRLVGDVAFLRLQRQVEALGKTVAPVSSAMEADRPSQGAPA